MLTGSWKTVKAVIPQMIERGNGGSAIFLNSAQGLIGVPTVSHYSASKHGVVGLIKALAAELAPYGIRANTVNPGNVDTPMVDNDSVRRMFMPHLTDPTRKDAEHLMWEMSALPVSWLEAREVSDAVLFLASEQTRHITGISLPIDAGMTIPSRLPKKSMEVTQRSACAGWSGPVRSIRPARTRMTTREESEVVESWSRALDREDVIRRIMEATLPVAPILTMNEGLDFTLFHDRGAHLDVDDGVGGPTSSPAIRAASASRGPRPRAGPR